MYPFALVLLLLLGVCGKNYTYAEPYKHEGTTAQPLMRSIFRDLVEEWNCSGYGCGGHPVCGVGMFFPGRQTFRDICELQEDTCEDPPHAKVPVTFGPCPPPRVPINCYFECPLGIPEKSLCGVNRFGFQRVFASLCDLVHHNCEQPLNRFHVIQCLQKD